MKFIKGKYYIIKKPNNEIQAEFKHATCWIKYMNAYHGSIQQCITPFPSNDGSSSATMGYLDVVFHESWCVGPYDSKEEAEYMRNLVLNQENIDKYDDLINQEIVDFKVRTKQRNDFNDKVQNVLKGLDESTSPRNKRHVWPAIFLIIGSLLTMGVIEMITCNHIDIQIPE